MRDSRNFAVCLLCGFYALFSPMILHGENRVEEYRYEAIPDGNPQQKETVLMRVSANTFSGSEFLSDSYSPAGVEEVAIQLDRGGQFLSGKRTFSPTGEALRREARIWTKGGTAYFQSSERNSPKRFDLSPDRPLIVDGSMIVLLRTFPFDSGNQWNLLAIDFSGASVGLTVHQTRREWISVPAGPFECYQIEVLVNLPLLRPKIVFWLTVAPPHFMVRQKGKRGPFTPFYVTELISARY